jgi:fluoride ion exporter CrcB/FEX
MKIQETTEYRMVKMLTAKENRKAIYIALAKVSLSLACMYAGMYGFMYFMLWLWKM